MTPLFAQLFEQQVMIGLSRQMALSDYLGGGAWQIQIDAGTLEIEGCGTFPIQVLGTESDLSNTWLWAWANQQSNFPKAVSREVNAIHRHGQAQGIEELTQPTFSLASYDPHQIAMVCAALSKLDYYYVAGYDNGALYTLIDGVPEQVDQVPLARINSVILDAINMYPFNHRTACLPYLRQQGLQIEETENKVVAARPGEGTLELQFSAEGRIEAIDGALITDPQAAAKKPWWRFW